MKTNLDELHEYQKRIYSFGIRGSNPTIDSVSDSQQQLDKIKSILMPHKNDKKADNQFIDIEDEKFHQILSKIGEGATSVTYKIVDNRTGRLMCKKILKIVEDESASFKTLQSTLKKFEILLGLSHPCICSAIGINTNEPVNDPNITTKNDDELTTIALFLEFEEYGLSE